MEDESMPGRATLAAGATASHHVIVQNRICCSCSGFIISKPFRLSVPDVHFISQSDLH